MISSLARQLCSQLDHLLLQKRERTDIEGQLIDTDSKVEGMDVYFMI